MYFDGKVIWKLRQLFNRFVREKPVKDDVRYGVIGYGVAGKEHARIVHDYSSANLTAICDIDENKRRSAVERYKKARVYSSVDDMLSSEKLHVVSICTPHNTHCPISIKCFQKGISVLCEKPIATSIEDAEKMIMEASKNGTCLGVISQYRVEYAPALLKTYVEEGKLGKIISTSVNVKFYRPREYYDGTWKGSLSEAGGGVLINQAIHMIDLAMWINGNISLFYSLSSSVRDYIDVEDNCVAVVRYSNGAFGTIDVSTSANPDFGMRLEVIGDRYSVVISGKDITYWGGKSKSEIRIFKNEIQKINYVLFQGRYFGYGHFCQIEDMISCVKRGGCPIITGEDALNTLRTVIGLMSNGVANRNKEIGQGVTKVNIACG